MRKTPQQQAAPRSQGAMGCIGKCWRIGEGATDVSIVSERFLSRPFLPSLGDPVFESE